MADPKKKKNHTHTLLNQKRENNVMRLEVIKSIKLIRKYKIINKTIPSN